MVQLNFSPEIEVVHMLFEISLSIAQTAYICNTFISSVKSSWTSLKRFLWLGAVRSCCVLAAFFLSKNAARSQSLEAQGSCCSFWPKLSNYLNLSKIRPCLAEIGPTLFQPNQQERTAPNQRNRLCMLNRNGSILEVIFSFHWCFVRVPRCAF